MGSEDENGQSFYYEEGHRAFRHIDRDFEREQRPRVTLILKAAGVLQPRIPERIGTTHDVGEVRCDCRACRKADPTREESPKVVVDVPLDGAR